MGAPGFHQEGGGPRMDAVRKLCCGGFGALDSRGQQGPGAASSQWRGGARGRAKSPLKHLLPAGERR